MEDKDILGPDEIMAPLSSMSNMAGLVEAAIKRAREEKAQALSQIGDASGTSERNKRPMDALEMDDARNSAKKTRFSPEVPSGHTVVEDVNPPPSLANAKGKAKARPKRTHIHAYPDAIAIGVVSEEEAKELFNM
jgi:hypothetical protein